VLRDLGAAGVGAGLLGGGLEALLARAAAAAPRSGSLKDIEHVVILMQENRSFDHYFGTYSGVRGFADKQGRAAFFQKNAKGKTVHPFHLPTPCLPDLTHDWAPQHNSWHNGRMDKFVTVHEAVDPKGVGVETMGYHTSTDINFYRALAAAFTICDGYHCSVIGPTDPNRLVTMTGTLDPAGKAGGPLIHTNSLPSERTPRFSWTTMPEQLEAHGVSWKVYTDPTSGSLDNVLTYFTRYSTGSTLASKGLVPAYPNDFHADLGAGTLPQVSWLLPSVLQSEHPGYSTPAAGEVVAREIIEAIVSHPTIWQKTALFITWDENGGFFDHVAPPVPPKGTPGEFLTVSTLPPEAQGIRGPIGLGFRVPMIIVSPFSRGGLVCSDVFDHTSMLRFVETRFGAEVPNLSSWRRKVTGDLTSAFNFAAAPQNKPASLPTPHVNPGCPSRGPVKVPTQAFPTQDPGTRKRPSGLVKKH